ncbi:short transient receptor potential channel 4-like [Colletes gigas]|uniref:short transient receptor potential channel 4-like n=1 Tax=Colletes gigas TaxID=935657 RepID=UPI001C9AE08B|nr:short transient receptor potential channel 4-like [Colletes gigas]
MEEDVDEDIPRMVSVSTNLLLLQRSSVIIPSLQREEKRFFDLVEVGSVPEVREFLESKPDFNINVADFQGVTALHIAVRNRNAAMVEYLLSYPDIDPGDTHLHAIRDNDIKITSMILNKLNDLMAGLEYVGVTHSTDFPDDTTPLAVAAQCGHFELINFLQRRHHTISKPHPPSCNCNECKSERERSDLLAIEKMRLLMYKAITNPAYICQTVEDPILEAFNLSYELNKAASFNKEFYHEYKTLSTDVAQFATDLIDCARTVDEVEEMLKQSTGFAHSSKFIYPRLLFALHYKQRTFVAHPNIQQLIESKWIEGWYEWKIMGTWMKCLLVILRVVMLPLILFVVFFAPYSNKSKFWQSPVNKYLSSTASYIVFLLFAFLQSTADKSEQLRGPPNTGILNNFLKSSYKTKSNASTSDPGDTLLVYVWIMIIYIIAYTWAMIRLCVVHGAKKFFTTPQYWFEVLIIFLFLLTFLYWIIAAVDVTINGQLELERKYWNKYDPTLIGEGIFCLATIAAFLKLLYICLLNYHLGPLQLSLGKMITDVVKFIILFSIIILAFTTGTCKLYQYYDEMVQIDDESKIKTQQVSSFVDFKSTLKTLFWALFCMSPIESADVIIENLPGESENETVINHHTFTEVIGYISFAGFTFISVIVILNMLIACMSNTMTKVTENLIVEWTFGRTETYVDYMLTTTLPPPFNIIPTYIGIQPVIEYVKIFLKPTEDKRARWSINHCCYIESLETEKNKQFSMVMRRLVQRYFRQKEKAADENEIERLRKEIVELRNLLRDALSTD